MNPHTLLVYSPDLGFAISLQAMLGDRVIVDPASMLGEVHRRVLESPPFAILYDMRRINDGGHAADRLLEDLSQTAPGIPQIMITGPQCPEPLERHAACGGVVLLRDNPALNMISEAVCGLLPKPDAVIVERPRETFGGGAMEGITRRFETNSPELKKMLDDLVIAASHNVTILLIGETGSGKTFLSRLIHEASPRRNEPFLHLACGALPRELIESELFGHSKGAFTSAHVDKDGKFLAAGRGTVLLDEIDVLGLEQQVKLLRVIETGEFEPVGSNRTYTSQARLVVASNLDLQPLVEQVRFRPDLYYRLSMLKFEIPPLRKRKVDIIPLAKKFVTQFTVKHGIQVHRIDDSLLDCLLRYPWPGNVRELEHVIQRAVIYCRDGVLSAEQLPPHIVAYQVGPTNDPSVSLGGRAKPADVTLGRQVALTEREIIEQTLFKNSFSRTKTARDLGISRVTLYNKMRKYDMLKSE